MRNKAAFTGDLSDAFLQALERETIINIYVGDLQSSQNIILLMVPSCACYWILIYAPSGVNLMELVIIIVIGSSRRCITQICTEQQRHITTSLIKEEQKNNMAMAEMSS